MHLVADGASTWVPRYTNRVGGRIPGGPQHQQAHRSQQRTLRAQCPKSHHDLFLFVSYLEMLTEFEHTVVDPGAHTL